MSYCVSGIVVVEFCAERPAPQAAAAGARTCEPRKSTGGRPCYGYKAMKKSLNNEKPDIYGQIHPTETPQGIETALKEFKDSVAELPVKQTTALRQAEERCPQLLTDDFLLLFLRCEVYNVQVCVCGDEYNEVMKGQREGNVARQPSLVYDLLDSTRTGQQANCLQQCFANQSLPSFFPQLAATRYAFYWEKRVDIFGPSKAFEPLTLSGALRDDMDAIQLGFIRLTGTKDPMGRFIVFGDPSRLDATKCSRESIIRATWYTFHCALQDESTQKHGVVMMVYPHHVQLHQFDRKLMKRNTECLKGAIPVRLAAFHVCHPPTFFAIVWQLLKVFLGKLRKRVKIHSGERDHVLAALSAFGLTKDVVPTDIGGDVVLDMESWLQQRRAME